MRWVRENARALRALVATVVAVFLAVLVINFERANTQARETTVRNLNTMLWSVSELNFESQRLATALVGLRGGQYDIETARLRYDVLWSRVDVVRMERFKHGTGFHALVAEFDAFLEGGDPVLFGQVTPDDESVQLMIERLKALTFQSRQLWTQNFGNKQSPSRVLSDVNARDSVATTEYAALVLVSILLTYVVAEVYFSGRGQKRERELRMEAAEANAAKSRFLANVSHEIRTPLNGILGMTSELAETELTEDQTLCVRVIEESGGVLLGTINDVLDLSRIEAGQLSIDEHPFDLRELVEAACSLYGAGARQKGLDLTLHVQENLAPVVIGDAVRIRQVLHNLVANAVKFTEKGGVRVQVRSDLGGSRLVISVQDSGPGIDRAAQARIFEPFLQADAGVTRRHGGSGLGLTISRQLCQTMGGDLTLVSRPGHGATFFCDLPLQAATGEQIKQARRAPVKSPDLHGKRILVADDNATNRLILSRFLKATRADLTYVETGEAAVEAVRDGDRFDVILMDVQMPVLDGVGATRQIREMERQAGGTPTAIVAVTANVLSHQVQEYREAGMDQVLGKPVSKRDLMALLAKKFGAEPEAEQPTSGPGQKQRGLSS
ncbi:ATP-binding protein [Antarctobacter jejuensis]|uniref:ATP-binding protein n=1 Tax=Antarctobacter jejuensis TaxID=1439938 RepID=UPI003FD56FED